MKVNPPDDFTRQFKILPGRDRIDELLEQDALAAAKEIQNALFSTVEANRGIAWHSYGVDPRIRPRVERMLRKWAETHKYRLKVDEYDSLKPRVRYEISPDWNRHDRARLVGGIAAALGAIVAMIVAIAALSPAGANETPLPPPQGHTEQRYLSIPRGCVDAYDNYYIAVPSRGMKTAISEDDHSGFSIITRLDGSVDVEMYTPMYGAIHSRVVPLNSVDCIEVHE